MDADRLTAMLVEDLERNECSADLCPTGTQLEYTLAFANNYERRGLISDNGSLPLWRCCPNAEACWRPKWDARPEDGNISLPWVGPDYAGDVVIVGVNFNDASALSTAFQFAAYESQAFARGVRKITYDDAGYKGTMFPYGSARGAGAVMDWLDGSPIRDRTEPEDLVEVLPRVVRLQAVKCSPRDGGSSEPTGEMWTNCRDLLFGEDLAIARPGAILGFGDAKWSLETLPGYEVRKSGDHMARGILPLADRAVPVFTVAHPGSRHGEWSRGHASLIAALQEDQATA